jgi:hypothetical protein
MVRRPPGNADGMPPGPSVEPVEYATPWWVVGAAGGGGLALALLAALGADLDPAGRLLVVAGAAVLVALAGRGAALRPSLRADEAGLVVVSGLRRVRVPWPDLGPVRAAAQNRRGLVHLRTLELDVGDEVLVVGRLALGAEPVAVAREIERRRTA